MVQLYAILVAQLPRLQKFHKERRDDGAWQFKEVTASLVEILRMLEIQHLLLQKPISAGDGMSPLRQGSKM